MAGKKVNHIVIIVFIIVSVILIFIDIGLQFRGDNEIYKKSEIISMPEESPDSTNQVEEEIQLPVDFME